MSTSTSNISKKKITKNAQTKQTRQNKKKIENKLNNILLSLDNQLSYDLTVDDDFKSTIYERDMTVNINKINKLPTFNMNFKTKQEEDDANTNNGSKKNRKITIENTNNNNNEDDEYIKTLVIEKVGNIFYRFDYDKGIIYDMKMNEVGHIDDCGDICILNDNENDDINSEQDETI